MPDPTSAATTPTPTHAPQPSGLQGLWRGWVRPFLVAMAVLFTFRSAVLDWNVVPSGSMRPTIVEGDYIVVNKVAYDLKVPFTRTRLLEWGGPARGDVVVFVPPGESDRFVKRVVGVPGDRVEMRGNRLYVNGLPAAYEELDPQAYQGIPAQKRAGDVFALEVVAGRAHAIALSPGRGAPDSFGPVVVPEGHYFVLGDNRDDSKDSRYFGFVPRQRVLGKATAIAVSLDPWDHHLPRWGRFFLPLS